MGWSCSRSGRRIPGARIDISSPTHWRQTCTTYRPALPVHYLQTCTTSWTADGEHRPQMAQCMANLQTWCEPGKQCYIRAQQRPLHSHDRVQPQRDRPAARAPLPAVLPLERRAKLLRGGRTHVDSPRPSTCAPRRTGGAAACLRLEASLVLQVSMQATVASASAVRARRAEGTPRAPFRWC